MTAMSLSGGAMAGAHGIASFRTNPVALALMGAVTVGVISGASIAATVAIQNEKVSALQSTLETQTERAVRAEADLALLKEQAAAAETSAARRVTVTLDEIAALKEQVAQGQVRQGQTLEEIQRGVEVLRSSAAQAQ